MQMESAWHIKSILLLIRSGNRMWHGKVLMPYIKVGFPKRPGAKQKFLFAVVTLLNCPIIRDNVMQLTGSCLVTEAIFFKAQTSHKTIKKSFSKLMSTVSGLYVFTSDPDKFQCMRRVSSVSRCPGLTLAWGYLGQEEPGCARIRYQHLTLMIVFQCLIQRSLKLMERFTLT